MSNEISDYSFLDVIKLFVGTMVAVALAKACLGVN